MDRRLRLPAIVGEALFLFTLGYFVLDVLFVGCDPSLKADIASWAVIVVPIFVASWWLFRKVRQIYSRREAAAAAIVFGVSSPVALLVATPFATLPGNLVAGLLGPSFGLVGAFGGLVILTGLFILIPMALALWVARHVKPTRATKQAAAKSR